MSPLMDWRPRGRLLLSFLLGIVAAFGLAPFGFWPATVISLAALPFVLGAVPTRREAAWCGWLYGTGCFALALAWIVDPFLVDIAVHGWMAPFALVFMAGGLALFWAAAFWGAAAMFRDIGGRVAALIVTWTIAEYLRGHVLTGFPWAAPGQIWVGTNADQLLAWVGPEGLNLLTFLGALPLGLVLIPASGQAARLTGIVPALAIVVLTGIKGPPPQPELTLFTVRLIQPNAPQDQKWDPAYMPLFFERQIEFTAAEPRPDLVVWPEVSLPNRLDIDGDPLSMVIDAAGGADIVLGILRPDADGYYNALVRLDGTGSVAGIYDKHHLVPFGEYVPLRRYVPEFGLSALASVMPGDMAAGPGPQVMDFGSLGTAIPLICYEVVFPRDVANAPGRASFLLQITNDAWFGKFSGPFQHLAQARMRAIEQGLPLARAANTGISAMIDPYGRIIDSLPLGEAGFVDAALPAPLAPTLYAKTGDWPVLWLLAGALLGLLGRAIGKNRAKGD